MVDGLPPLVVHEEVVEDGAQLGRQARQEVHHAQPRHADLGPGDVERQQHQEADQGDAWERGGGDGAHCEEGGGSYSETLTKFGPAVGGV